MTKLGQNRSRRLRGMVRDVFVLVLAEVVVLAFAWCLSPRGRSMLARLFRGSRPDNSPTIDV